MCWCYGFVLVSPWCMLLQALTCLHTHPTIDLFPWYNGNCNFLQKGVFQFLCAACSNERGWVTGFIYSLGSINFLVVSLLLLLCYSSRSCSCIFSCIRYYWTMNGIVWESDCDSMVPKLQFKWDFNLFTSFQAVLCRSMSYLMKTTVQWP